jgi:hypothetical protein
MEWLSEEFYDHGKKYNDSSEYYSTAFNLPIALKSMVDEIVMLRKKLDELSGKSG